MFIKVKIKSSASKSEWPSYIAHYYDQVYPPFLAKLSSEIEQEVMNNNNEVIVEEEQGGISDSDESSEKIPELESKDDEQVSLEEPVSPTLVSQTVVETIQKPKAERDIKGALLKIGVPVGLVFVVLAVVWQIFF